MRRFLVPFLFLAAMGWTGGAFAVDPRNAPHAFTYRLYPPGGFSVKKSKAPLRGDPNQPKAHPLIGPDGKFTELGQWYFDLGSDPKHFATWWHGYFADAQNWPPCRTPVYAGTAAINQGHRIIAWLGPFNKMIQAAPDIDADVKKALCSEEWKRAVEKTILGTINKRGLLEHAGNTIAMAQVFHFLRTKFGALGLQVDTIYNVERSQDLICTLLTEPSIINSEDRYLDPPSLDYLESLGKQIGGRQADIRIVKEGKILYTGGLFIGWKNVPALHGAWDGLSIINTLFKYHPDPDPSSPKSIFYKWNQLSEDKKRIGRRCLQTMSRRLWLDWQQNKGPTWCWVVDGLPSTDGTRTSDAPFRLAYDGYGDNQYLWAKLCWDEMFGEPHRNTNDGVQALLAVCEGRIHRHLKTPKGQQVPGRYDFDPAVQAERLAEDEAAAAKLAPPEAMKKDKPASSKGR